MSFKALHYNLVSIEKSKFYVNITADLLYDERIPIDELVPSVFQKIAFFFDGLMNGFRNFYNRVDTRDPYGDKNYSKSKLDKIVGT